MHKHVLRYTTKLDLNNYELEYTRKEIRGALWNAYVGILSIIFAAAGIEWLAGICYLLIPILLIVNHKLFTLRIKRKMN